MRISTTTFNEYFMDASFLKIVYGHYLVVFLCTQRRAGSGAAAEIGQPFFALGPFPGFRVVILSHFKGFIIFLFKILCIVLRDPLSIAFRVRPR